MPPEYEEWIASLIAAAGLVWGVYLATHNFTSLNDLEVPRDPMYVTAIGVVLWLHAKWRRSVDMRRA